MTTGNSGVIAIVKSGCVLPADLKIKLLDAHPSAFGYAMSENGMVDMNTLDGEEMEIGSSLDNLEKACGELTRVYHFASIPDGIEDEQPVPIIVKDNKVILSCMAEGDFANYVQEDSTFSGAYHMIQEYMAEECKGVFQDVKEDVAKMMEVFQTPRFRKNMQNVLGPRGVIVLIGSEGDPTVFAKNEDGAQMKFGYVSKTLGFKEEEPVPVRNEPAVAAPEKPMSAAEKFAARLAKTNDGAAQPVRASVPAVEQKPQPEVVGALGPAPAKDEEVVSCPDNLMGKPRKKWHRDNLILKKNELPVGWNSTGASKNTYPVSMLKPGSSLKPFTKTFQDAAKELQKTPGPDVVTEGAVPPPIVPAAQRAKAMAIVKESGFADNGDELEKLVEKFPPWTEQHQIPFEDAIRMSFKTIRRLAEDRQSISCWCRELQLRVLKHEPQLLKKPVIEAKKEEQPMTAAEKFALKTRKAM